MTGAGRGGADDPESAAAQAGSSDSATHERVTNNPSDLVLVTFRDRVAVITLNDPAQRNALTPRLSHRLAAAVTELEDNPQVNAVIITGAGTAFCAGAHRSVTREPSEQALRAMYEGFLAVAECTLPTIAAVNGPAVGAGFNLALACDVRIAGPTALFDARFVSLGVHPGGGMTWMLHRAAGPQVAKAALLFGDRFDAGEAVRHRIALRVDQDPVDGAMRLARAAAEAPREVILNTKATMRATVTPGTLDVHEHRFAVHNELGPQLRSATARTSGP